MSCAYFYIGRRFLRTAEIIKKNYPSALIVIGGSHATVSPKSFMKNKVIDIIVLGEAETAMKYLLKSINQKELQPIPGAYVLKNGKYIYGGKRRPALPQEIYQSQKMVLEARKKESEQEKQQKFLTLEFSRGCSFDCTFCYAPKIRENLELAPNERVRYIPPKAAVNLLKIAADHGFFRVFCVSDSLTSLPPKWLGEFLVNIKVYFSKIKTNDVKNSEFAFEASPIDILKDYVVDFLKEMSRFFVLSPNFGIESFDKETLSKFNKPHKNNLQEVIKKLKEISLLPNIFPHFSLIWIHPWTTFKEIRRIINFIKYEQEKNKLFCLYPITLLFRSEGLKIIDTIKKENLFLRVGGNNEFKFKYAKIVPFPKDENDTDIGRLASFIQKLNKIHWFNPSKFMHSLKAVGETAEEIKKKFFKKIDRFFINIVYEAENEWPKLTYGEYEKRCQKKLKELLTIFSTKKYQK